MNCCIVIPHYNHEKLFAKFLPKLLALNLPCIVVDDGSSEESLVQLMRLLEAHPDFRLVKHQQNRGKGAAVRTGIYHASALGFSHVLQLDADGQHDVNDVQSMMKYAEVHPHTIVCGQPYFDASAPKIRVYGRKITDFWVALETFSFKIKDGLCGFRIYPVKEIEAVIDSYYVGPRMDFDPELLVKAVWADIDVKFLPTKVIYHLDTVSHFDYLRDNGMMIKLHVRLIVGMLIRLPFLVHNRIKSILS